ncbi:MAG TPA: hypothetical protein VEC14_01090 [Reyranellaceae bacterium]|nr:hypothetical protein [Reyranellaceae bacterium]
MATMRVEHKRGGVGTEYARTGKPAPTINNKGPAIVTMTATGATKTPGVVKATAMQPAVVPAPTTSTPVKIALALGLGWLLLRRRRRRR